MVRTLRDAENVKRKILMQMLNNNMECANPMIVTSPQSEACKTTKEFARSNPGKDLKDATNIMTLRKPCIRVQV